MKAKCSYFGKCSGCTLQQFPYVKQLHDKGRRIHRELGSLLPKNDTPESFITTPFASPLEHGYRTSGKLCLHEDEIGRRSVGLYERGSKKVLAIPQCTVHHPEINKLLDKLFGFGKKLPAPLYQHTRKSFQPGRLKFIVVRYDPDTREFGVILSHTGVDRTRLTEWGASLNLGVISIYESELTPSDEDLVVSRNVNHLAGPKTFRLRLGDHDWNIDPIAFFQANFSLVPKFVETIAAPHEGSVLLDLYGGFGTYSFQAAAKFREVIIVEANPHSIASADDLIRRSGLKHIKTAAASVEDFFRTMKAAEAREVSNIIVNPPRAGLSRQVVAALLASRIENLKMLTYVSCDVGTLRRDLKDLVQSKRFAIETVTPFDMFPQTDHIETVVHLKAQPPARAKP